MTPEKYRLAKAKFSALSANPLVLFYQGEFESHATAHNWHFYKEGFNDGVESVDSVKALEQSLKIKDLRLDILEKENRNLKLRLEHRKKLHDNTLEELKTVIDRLSLIIGLRDPSLLKEMQVIRERLLES